MSARCKKSSLWFFVLVAVPASTFVAGCEKGVFDTKGGVTLEVTSALRTCSSTALWTCIDAVVISSRAGATGVRDLVVPLEGRSIISEGLVVALPADELTTHPEGVLIVATGVSSGAVLVEGQVRFTYDDRVPQRFGINMTEQYAACDSDGDGYESCACDERVGCDCNDQHPGVHPLATERCGDGIDSDCDGAVGHEGCNPCEGVMGKPCSDEPVGVAGVGACKLGVSACDAATGAVTCLGFVRAIDEIDTDNIDNDCDGVVDEGTACTATTPRDCFMGLIGASATARAVGVCELGKQSCVDGFWADQCVGEKRATVSGDELLCDGLDENCNGLVDETPRFDADGDGFTICGTCATTKQRAPIDPADLPALDGNEALVCNGAVDCDDDPAGNGSLVSPGRTELCTTPFDDDCRCDHDDPRAGVATVGEPSLRVAGGRACGAYAADLHCDILPRSDTAPTGVCDEATGGPYYDGIFELDGAIGCYKCAAPYGLTCDVTTGRCAANVAAICTACDAVLPPSAELLHSTRAVCKRLASGCTGAAAPVWQNVPSGQDPFDDCPGDAACNGSGACP